MEQERERAEDLLGDADAPFLSSREAAHTLIGAVERAGDPWRFVPLAAMRGLEVSRTWPLVLPDGEVLGVVVRVEDDPVDEDELINVLLRTFATLVSTEREAAAARQRTAVAEREARIDPLTGLPNRRAWDDALAAESARMSRHERAAAIIVVDLDGLKEANDSGGHLAGDLLIRRTAVAIRAAVRDEDVVARLGGDEFGVLAVEADPPVPEALLRRIRDALAEVDVPASVGAASAEPASGIPLEAAFAEADRQMYLAKQRHKDVAADEPGSPGERIGDAAS